ncbi:MAG: hypothetical protein PHI34_05385, partial [Acidobacteriota bacterium]|nr:hypothetical protein [Acidobacteriota bacterium]
MGHGWFSGRRADAAILATFAVLSILMTWPLAGHLSSHVAGDPHDTLYTLYAMSWSYRALAGTGDFWNANIFYPYRGVLAYGDPILGLTLLGAPIRLLTENPILVFNLLFLFSFFLCAAGAYALARRLTGSRPAAFLAGLIFAFCPYRFAHISHLEILNFAWIPITLLFMHAFFERPTWGRTFGMAAGFVLQVLCCAYYGAFFALFAALFVLIEAVRTGWWRRGRFWVRAAGFMGISGACLAPYLVPFFKIQARMMYLRPHWEVEYYSAQLQHYLAVPPWNRFWGGWLGRLGGVEWQHFPGLIAIILAAWGWTKLQRRAAELPLPPRPPGAERFRFLFGLWDAVNAGLVLLLAFLAFRPGFSAILAGLRVSGRRIEDPLVLLILSSIARLACDARLRGRLVRLVRAVPAPARFYAIAGGLAFLLSLGPSIRIFGRKILTGPYEWLYAWFPGFKGLRAANRFSILVVLALAVFAAYAVADGLRRKPGSGRAWLIAGLSGLILVESWAVPLPLSKIPYGGEVPGIYRAVAALPDTASLVEYPMPARDDEEWRDAWPVYFSTFHWKNLVNGYSGYAPPAYRIVREPMQQLPSKASFDLLEGLQVGYVLAHVGSMPARERQDFLFRMA